MKPSYKNLLIYFLFSFFLIFTFFAGLLIYVAHNEYLDFSALENTDHGTPSLLIDDTGTVWGSFEFDRHKSIPFNQLPDTLIKAFIATEDHTFFSHHGISLSSIIRSMLINLYYGRIVQGASTITQQLAKCLFTDSSKTFKRKIKEQIYALLLEHRFSKEQILEVYLNNVYFGAGLYGVEAASQAFWGISARNLSLDQSATLAAIVKHPAHYCPLWYPLSARQRRNIVLHSMHSLGYISKEMYAKTIEMAMQLQPQKSPCSAPHAKEYIRAILEPIVGKKALYKGGLRIQTTLNQKLQTVAEQAFHEQISNLRQQLAKPVDGGVIAINAASGEIKALVGGFDFSTSQFNRALHAQRQIGSTIKPFLYSFALLNNHKLTDVSIDEPMQVKLPQGIVWEPRNSTRRFEGPMTLARALSTSNNIITIKTLLNVGVDRFAHFMEQFEIRQEIASYPSLALGCIDCTLKEVAQIFNVFANQGTFIEATIIHSIHDQWGKKISLASPKKKKLLDARYCSQIMSVLRANIMRACARSKTSTLHAEAFGKTGTTNDSRTNWFVGATPGLTTAIYIGCDDNSPLGKNIFGSRTAFPVWHRIHQHYAAFGSKLFSRPPGMQEVIIDSFSGTLAHQHSTETIAILLPTDISG